MIKANVCLLSPNSYPEKKYSLKVKAIKEKENNTIYKPILTQLKLEKKDTSTCIEKILKAVF